MQIDEHTQPTDEVNEFDRLFNEDEQANSTLAQPSDDDQNQPDPATPAQPQELEAGKEQGGGAAPGDGSEAAGEPSTEQPGAPTTSDGEPADWLSAVPEEVRTRIEQERQEAARAQKQLEDRYNALHGRLAPVQQALSDAQRRLQEQQRQAQTTPATTAPEAPDSFFDSDTFKQWAEDFPGDAKVYREGLEAQRKQQEQAYRQLEQQVSQLAERLAQTEQVATQTTRETEEQKLDAAHPDWRELNNSDEFWEWFDGYRAAQPKVMQRNLFYNDEALRDAFADSSFVVSMLDQYKATRAPAQESATTVSESTQTSAPVVTPPANNARLNMGRAPDVRGNTPVPRSVPLESLSPEEQFAHLWNQAE